MTLTDLDQLYANFTLPEQDRASVAVGQPVELRVDAFPGEVFKGEITAIEPQIDPSTRVMRVQATLANPGAPAAARHVRQRPGGAAAGARTW